jgi:signal transduction histidine kinase
MSTTAAEVTTSLWRGTVVLRVVMLGFAAVVVADRYDLYARAWLGWTVLAVMAVWTVVTVACYTRDAGRRTAVVGLDLVVTAALMWVAAVALGSYQVAAGAPLVTTLWASGVVVAAGVAAGQLGGLLAGAVVAAVNYVARGYVDTDLIRDTVLLLCAGFVVGLCADTARRTERRLRRALHAEATTAERERLARAIHDGVLQVLAQVARRGGELATPAAEQEVALRALMAGGPPAPDEAGLADLRQHLQQLATTRVQVSVPATPVPLPGPVAAGLTGIAREALANVDRHAGPDARAWLLVEDLGAEVVLTVRDDGVGIPPGRLTSAAEQGRLGVSGSIRGRAAELGGTASLRTAPGDGTEWEVRVPR